MLIVGVLLATVLLRVAIIAPVVYLLLPKGALCPLCQVEMLLVRNRFLALILPAVEPRWCLECGWYGVVRRGDVTSGALVPQPPSPRSSTPA